jgi:hypothetical protein
MKTSAEQNARPLLPLREKVSAKLTDEGSRRRLRFTPHPTPFGGHLLPQGEKER